MREAGNVPITVYAEIESYRIKSLPFKNVLVQPEAGLLNRYGIKTIPQLVDKMRDLGFKGVNWDTNHLNGCLPLLGMGWIQAINELEESGFGVKECQLSVGREPNKFSSHDSKGELEDVTNNTNSSGIWDKVDVMRLLEGNIILETKPFKVNKPSDFYHIAQNIKARL